ncbi:MAG: GntR family transcriptional regulator [Christensenellales bacterium]
MIEDISFKKPLDLNEWAYMTIKMRILEHELSPGSQLNIEDMSKELGISRTPIREALLRLKQSGLVYSASRVGFFVSGVTKNDFDNIFELRQIIEGYAAERSVSIISEKEIDDLFEINENSRIMVNDGRIMEYNRFETKLHNSIINCLNNNKIRDVMDSVDDLLYRLRIYALTSVDNLKSSIDEHAALLTKIKERNAAFARAAMEEHISNVKKRLREIVEFHD